MRNQAGALTLGRQYAPHYLTTAALDPFASGTAGDSKNLILAVGSGGRLDNSVKYATPSLVGFNSELAYSAGEIAGSSVAARQLGASLSYASGPIVLRVAHHYKNNDTATIKADLTRNTIVGGTYDFNIAKLYAAYGIDKGPLSSPLRNAGNPFGFAVAPTAASITTDSTDMLVGVGVPIGAHTLLASYIRKNDRTSADRDADQIAVGYRYTLSKRTDFYTVYARINNRNRASYTVGNSTDSGSGNRAFNIGIRHTF